MTEAPRPPVADVGDPDAAAAVLREAGLRITSARRVLLEALFAAEGPTTAERLGGSEELASTYRNLEVFERVGLVRHVHLGHGPGLYALAGGGEREYLVCERCGTVRTVEGSRLDRMRDWIEDEFAFRVRFSHFPLTGACVECAARTARRGDGDN